MNIFSSLSEMCSIFFLLTSPERHAVVSRCFKYIFTYLIFPLNTSVTYGILFAFLDYLPRSHKIIRAREVKHMLLGFSGFKLWLYG